MKRWSLAAIAVALMAVLAWSPARPHPVHAATTWQVSVDSPAGDEPIAFDAYFPHELTINAGDTVNWNFFGFHTVTFNAGQPDLPLVEPGSNPGDLLLGPGYFPFPPGPNPPSGNYDGGTQISSGTPPNTGSDQAPPPFTLTFTKSGVYRYECTVHPGMHGVVTVLAAGAAPAETPDQAQSRGDAEKAELLDAIHENADGYQPAFGSGPAASAATVAVGIGSAEGVGMLGFLPGNLTVHAGDLVTFTDLDPFETHTVTFLSGAPEPDFITPAGPPTNGPPQLVIPASIAQPQGGPVYSGEGFFNSGLLGPMTHQLSYVLAFDTPGTYQYYCAVHDFMKGTITVVP